MENTLRRRKRLIRQVTAWLIMLSWLLPTAAVAQTTKSLQSIATMQAKLLKSLHPGMTLAQVKRLFPVGTVISSTPEWCGGDSHLGNYFYLHGSISGSLSFLDHKRDFGEGQKYHPTDPINDLRLTTPVLPTSKRAGYLYIRPLA